MIDKEKQIKHEMYEISQDIRNKKKQLLLLKKELLNLYGEKKIGQTQTLKKGSKNAKHNRTL